MLPPCSTPCSPEKKIFLRVEPDAKEAKISLSDTGPGIPRQALKKIFDDFFRVDDELPGPPAAPASALPW